MAAIPFAPEPNRSASVSPCFHNPTPFILASASPRRREMLTGLGLRFEIEAAEADERVLPAEAPADFVRRIARHKAMIVAERHPETWILAADTAVVLDGDILGKPLDDAEAGLMLRRLSGRQHEVWTGFCLVQTAGDGPRCLAVKTDVHFAELSDPIIAAYVRSGDPRDKAGGYGIQSLGGFLVREICGSYSNVVGLPLAEVLAEMTALGLVEAGGEG